METEDHPKLYSDHTHWSVYGFPTMQQYAVTNDVKGCDAWLLQRPQLKDYFIMNLFNLSKTN